MVWHGKEWALPCNIAKKTTTVQPILARSSMGTRTAPSFAGNQDGGEKYATDGPNYYVPETTSLLIGTRHVRSLTAVGTVQEQVHKTKRCQWNILGLCVVRWKKKKKNFVGTSNQKGYKLSFSARKDRHEHELDFSFTRTL